MAKHHQLSGFLALHPPFYRSLTDPALDAGNHVMAGKGWYDTAENALKVRNEANNAWITVLGSSSGFPMSKITIVNVSDVQDGDLSDFLTSSTTFTYL